MNPEDALAWAVTGLVVIIAVVIAIPIVAKALDMIITIGCLIVAGMIILVGFGFYLLREYVFLPLVGLWKRVLGL